MRPSRYKIKFEFEGEKLEYNVSDYKIVGNFLKLFVNGKKLYFNSNQIDYFEVTPICSESDVRNFSDVLVKKLKKY